MLNTGSAGLATAILLASAFLALLVKLYLKFAYFSKWNIPYEKPRSIIGSVSFSKCMPHVLWDLYKKSGDHKLYGFFIFWSPTILINDLNLIKLVLVKNFSSFSDRGVWYDEKRDPTSAHLFALEGERWKKLRAKLSPAFTSGRIKLMLPTVMRFGDKMLDYIAAKPETESTECYLLAAKYTLSNIASVAFGIESDIFDDNSEFMKMALKFNAPNFEHLIRTYMLFHLRRLVKIMLFYKNASKEISSFYLDLTKNFVAYREDNNITRDDFLQTLIELKNKGFIDESSSDGVTLTMNQITAQAFVFIIGGFDTSALAQSWALYELACNPDIQQRLQAEIDNLQEWTYENILQLEYLEMVLNETLRKYPTVPFLVRHCTENFKVPDSDIIIEKGSDINISIYGLHRDPNLFPDPDKFDPERFHPINPTHEIKPYSYLPFGEGPRFCIGMRFAKIQVKVGLAKLMKHYTVEPSAETKIPARIHPYTIQPTAQDGLWLKFKKRVV